MRKLRKISSLLLILTTSILGSNFLINDFNKFNKKDNIENLKSFKSKDQKYYPNESEKLSLSILNILFQEDMTIKMKYNIQTTNPNQDLNLSFINDNIYGTQIAIMPKGEVDINSKNAIEFIPFESSMLIQNIDGLGISTTESISLTNNLYEVGTEYDAYIIWHEYDKDPSQWFGTTNSKTFTTPISPFPKYSLKREFEGATQSLLSFNVDYDESLTGIEEYDASIFFKNARLNWENNSGWNIMDLTENITPSNHSYENVWLEWDSLDTSFTYYLLVSNLSEIEHDAFYEFQYNSNNFSSNQLVSNEDDPIKFNAGKKYLDLPKINFDYHVSDSPDSLQDYQTVFLDFSVSPNDEWKDEYEYIKTSLGDKSDLFELDPKNSLEKIKIDNIKGEDGLHPEGVPNSFETEYINSYDDPLETIEINNLKPGTKYTANATLGLNKDSFGKVFDSEEITIPISFKTIDTVNQPTLTYIGDNDLDNSSPDNWSRDELIFNLQKGSWDFDDSLIQPYELFEEGNIKIDNIDDGTSQTIDIDNNILSKLVEGENTLDTNILSANLSSGKEYSFILDLTYGDKAKGLFNQEKHPTIYGNFSTKEKISSPIFRFKGSNFMDDDKTSLQLNFEIEDTSKEFIGIDNEPLTLAGTFNRMYISDVHEITDDGIVSDHDDEIDFSQEIKSSDLVTSDIGQNSIIINNLYGDSTYEFTAVLETNPIASDHDKGWLKKDDFEITAKVSTNSKFDSIELNLEEIYTKQTLNSSNWETSYKVSIPKGNEIDSGLNSPGSDIKVSYELFDDEENLIQSNSINDWAEDIDESKLSSTINIKGLNSHSNYLLKTSTSFNDKVIESVIEDSSLVSTGINQGLTNDKLIADWGFVEDDVEAKNVYDNIYVSLSANESDLSSEKIQGIESIDLLSPMGNIVSTTNEKISSTQKPMLKITEPQIPGTILSGYKVRINNNSDTEDSGEYLNLEDFSLPLLSGTDVTLNSIPEINPTSAKYSFNFLNFNNINSVNFTLMEKDDWNSINVQTLDRTFFDESISGSKAYEWSVPKGFLNESFDYSISIHVNYIDGVDVISSKEDFTFEFTTPDKGRAKFEVPQFESSNNSIQMNLEWKNNTLENIRLDKVVANIYSPKDNYNSPISGEQSTTITGDFGNEVIEFTDLNPGIEYKIIYSVYYEDSTYSTIETSCTTSKKETKFSSSFLLSEVSENAFSVEYSYSGLTFFEDPKYNAVSNVKFNIYEGKNNIGTPIITEENILTKDDPNSGNKYFTYENKDLIKPNHSYTLEEVVTFTSYSSFIDGNPKYDTATQNSWITIKYNNSNISSEINFVDEDSLDIRLMIDNPNEFIYGGKINVSLYSYKGMVIFNLNGKKTTLDNTELNYSNLSPFINDSLSDETRLVYDLRINGVYAKQNESLFLDIDYNGEKITESTKQKVDPSVDPNSIKALNRVKYNSTSYLYELSLNSQSSVDLQNDISFTSKNSTSIDSSSINVVGENFVEETDIKFKKDNLYIKVNSNFVVGSDWRRLDFLVDRYIVVDNAKTKTLIDFNSQSAFYISNFDMIPLPKEPMTFGQVLLIIFWILLSIIIVWIILYKIFKYYDKEKWYEFAIKKANSYFFMNRKNMLLYGWNHKYNEYSELANMTIPQLKEYSIKIGMPIPYGYNKQQMVDLLSLLTDTELIRVKEFFDHEIKISEKVREELILNFQLGHSKPRWVRKRLSYIIDRSNRMQNKEYKKSLTDNFVDFYIVFSKYFVLITDKTLIFLKIKKNNKVTTKNINNENFDYESNSNIGGDSDD